MTIVEHFGGGYELPERKGKVVGFCPSCGEEMYQDEVVECDCGKEICKSCVVECENGCGTIGCKNGCINYNDVADKFLCYECEREVE